MDCNIEQSIDRSLDYARDDKEDARDDKEDAQGHREVALDHDENAQGHDENAQGRKEDARDDKSGYFCGYAIVNKGIRKPTKAVCFRHRARYRP